MKLMSRLAVCSLVGALYALGGVGVVLYGVPSLWKLTVASTVTGWVGEFAADALLILSMVAVAGGLIFLGSRLAGGNIVAGRRAGVFLNCVAIVTIALLTCWVGRGLEGWLTSEGGRAAGVGLTGGLALALILLALRGLRKPGFEALALQLEEQGWFSTAAYKRLQGQRVRRGTILGILVLAGCGIYTLLAHRSLGSGVENNWDIPIPFANGAFWRLLPHVQFTVPILLALGALWLAFRIVNYPTFADFLIATEAELNKVSWTTRKRLVQDTIVVLTTVFLLTVFLFVVDVSWGWLLSRPWIGVLLWDTPTELKKENIDW